MDLQRRSTMPPPLFGVLFLPTGMYQDSSPSFSDMCWRRTASVWPRSRRWSDCGCCRKPGHFWQVLVIDSCLTCVRWYIVAVGALALCSVGFAFLPLQAANSGMLAVLCLATGIRLF